MTKKVTFNEENLIQAQETIDEYRQEERSKLRYEEHPSHKDERPSYKRSYAFSENDAPTIMHRRGFERSDAFKELIQNAIDDAERSNSIEEPSWQERSSSNKQTIGR